MLKSIERTNILYNYRLRQSWLVPRTHLLLGDLDHQDLLLARHVADVQGALAERGQQQCRPQRLFLSMDTQRRRAGPVLKVLQQKAQVVS